MGKNQSKNKNGVKIITDSQCTNAGDLIRGTVSLNIQEKFMGNLIEIQFIGKEYTYWHYNEQQGNHKKKIKVTDKQIIFQKKAVLYKFPFNCIDPGQFNFPFEILTDHNLQGSFCYKGHNVEAEVYYKVKVVVYDGIQNSKEALIDHQYVEINQIAQPITNKAFKQDSSELVTWCCFSHGHGSIKCYFNKSAFYNSEQLIVLCEADNSNGKIDFNHIVLELEQNYEFFGKKSEYSSDHHSIKHFECIAKFYGQGAKFQQGQLNKLNLELPLTIPACTKNLPSYNGHLIKVFYQLRIYCELDGCVCYPCCHGCCGKFPKVILPVQIYQQPAIQQQVLIPQNIIPEQWNPQIQPLQRFQFSDEQRQQYGIDEQQIKVINFPPKQELIQQQQQYDVNLEQNFNEYPQQKLLEEKFLFKNQ